MKVKAFGERILAEMIDRPELFKKTASGLFISDKDGTADAIRPRWFRIYSVGQDIDWVNPGQYVYVEHGRWSNGVKIDNDLKIYLLDNKDILLVSDENPLTNETH
jgi:co-chaperonin GroES (HSP10)